MVRHIQGVTISSRATPELMASDTDGLSVRCVGGSGVMNYRARVNHTEVMGRITAPGTKHRVPYILLPNSEALLPPAVRLINQT